MAREGSIKKNESDILMLRRRQGVYGDEVDAKFSELELKIAELTAQLQKLIDNPNIEPDLSMFVKSEPIRRIEVIPREYWDKIQYPLNSTLYLVYDA